MLEVPAQTQNLQENHLKQISPYSIIAYLIVGLIFGPFAYVGLSILLFKFIYSCVGGFILPSCSTTNPFLEIFVLYISVIIGLLPLAGYLVKRFKTGKTIFGTLLAALLITGVIILFITYKNNYDDQVIQTKAIPVNPVK